MAIAPKISNRGAVRRFFRLGAIVGRLMVASVTRLTATTVRVQFNRHHHYTFGGGFAGLTVNGETVVSVDAYGPTHLDVTLTDVCAVGDAWTMAANSVDIDVDNVASSGTVR